MDRVAAPFVALARTAVRAYACLVVAGLATMATAATAIASPGDLDSATFNAPQGWRTQGAPVEFEGLDVAVDSSGRTIIAGRYNDGSSDLGAVVVLDAAGQLDITFDGPSGLGDGVVVWPSGVREWAAVTLGAGDEIHLVGTNSAGTTIVTQRLEPGDGSADVSWGSGNVTAVPVGTAAVARDAVIDNAGRLVILGNTTMPEAAVARLDAAGSLDGSFGTSGYRTFQAGPSTSAHAIAADSTGIYVVGRFVASVPQAFFAKMSVSGDPPSLTSTSGANRHEATSVHLLGSSLYVGGRAWNGTTFHAFAAWRLDTGSMKVNGGWNTLGNPGFDAGVELTNPTPVASDFCGSNAIGDVNADGRQDVVLGCQGDDTGATEAGGLIVFTRNGMGTGFAPGVEVPNPTPSTGDYCGADVATGDVNGDGRSDLIMGCYLSSSGATSSGNVVVFTRNAGNTGFDPGIELANPTPVGGDTCGESIAAGDVNGDGRSDVIIGCKGDDTGAGDAGNVVVFTRNAGNTGFDAAVELANPTPVASDLCGRSVAAGDVNGDGRGDVIVGCSGDDTGANNAGNVVVFVRNAANTGFETGVEIANPSPVASDGCGTSVAAGDVDGDGRDDVITGCRWDDTGAGDAGNVITFTRNVANTGFDAGVELANPTPASVEWCGEAVATGDVNGDGRSDIIAGCPGIGGGASGVGGSVAFVRNSTNTGFDAGIDLPNPSPVSSDSCGGSVSIGDVDGDGRDEPTMGCSGDDTGASNAGNAIIFTRNPANADVAAGESEVASGIVVEATGTVTLAGSVGSIGNERIALARFMGNGSSLDSTFGISGMVVSDPTPSSEKIRASAYADTDRIVVVGSSGTDLLAARFLLGQLVAASTSIDMTGCLPGTPGVTSFGEIAVGMGTVTPNDCTIAFGSGTDTAMLRVFQADASGAAMESSLTSAFFTDYSTSGSTWASGASIFGACLRSTSGSVINDGVTTWRVDASGTPGFCEPDDLDPWNGIPSTTAAVESAIARTSTTGSTGSVNLQFGVYASASQEAGTYSADLVFEVVAPSP